jgi:hypothetical protein
MIRFELIPEGEDGVAVVVEVHHQPVVAHKFNYNHHIITT